MEGFEDARISDNGSKSCEKSSYHHQILQIQIQTDYSSVFVFPFLLQIQFQCHQQLQRRYTIASLRFRNVRQRNSGIEHW
jgi:hypothetical protein